MKKLTLGDLAYDPTSGHLTDVRTGRRVGYQPKPSSKSPRYRQVRISGVLFYEHVLAWKLKTGRWPARRKEVDHRNGDGFDNRWTNFRLSTRLQNTRGYRRKSKGKTSGLRGVSFCSATKKWRADIRVDRTRINLGRFSSECEAFDAYRVAAVHHFGEFAAHK